MPIGILLAFGACRTPTAMVVRVETDAKCEDVRGASVAIGPLAQLESLTPASFKTGCSGSGTIGTLFVVPSHGKDAEIGVRVVLAVGAMTPETCRSAGYKGGCMVARRALHFLPHEEISLHFRMTVDCLDVPCGATTTCVRGNCVPAKVDDPAKCTLPQGCPPCVAPRADCNDDPSDGCETDLSKNKSDCGGCGKVCGDANGSSTCVDGICNLTCDPGFKDCDGDFSNGCEAELARDGANCSACGIDCREGGCNGGVCGASPTTLYKDEVLPWGVTLDATNIYWTNCNAGGTGCDSSGEGSVRLGPKAGGAPATTLAGKQGGPWGIVLDATNAYWTNGADGTLMKAPIGGGEATVLATAKPLLKGLGINSKGLVFVEQGDSSIASLPLSGGAPILLAKDQGGAYQLAVDEDRACWTNFGANVRCVSFAAGKPLDISTDEDGSNGIALDGGYVYWTTFTGGALFRAPVAGGPKEKLASNMPNASGIKVDAGFVYVAARADGRPGKGTIHRVPMTGGLSFILASGQSYPVRVASDATFLYWTNAGDGRVMRTTK